jgi:peptidoglycan/LPS O-acetylase OafA/YrhL
MVRFAWHRFLRIFPGFWVCLLVTAFVLAPALYYVREDTLAGFWDLMPSPVRYVTSNFWTSMAQYGIGDLLTNTPYGQLVHRSVFDGSLWSLRYEMLCYVLVLVLMVVGATRRRTGLLLVAFGVLVGLMLQDWIAHDRFGVGEVHLQRVVLPVVGDINLALMVPLAAVFLLGGLAACRPQHFVVDARLAALAALVAVGTMRYGGFDVFGVLAFAYVVLWMATLRTPRLKEIGVRQDWSYGVYIYAFPIQMCLAQIGVQKLGYVVYLIASVGLSLVAGFVSWHLVEKRAMKLKHFTVERGRFRRRPTSDAKVGPALERQDGADVEVQQEEHQGVHGEPDAVRHTARFPA